MSSHAEMLATLVDANQLTGGSLATPAERAARQANRVSYKTDRFVVGLYNYAVGKSTWNGCPAPLPCLELDARRSEVHAESVPTPIAKVSIAHLVAYSMHVAVKRRVLQSNVRFYRPARMLADSSRTMFQSPGGK
nr:hypothetical protein CFP56_52451 [Quercus suber]